MYQVDRDGSTAIRKLWEIEDTKLALRRLRDARPTIDVRDENWRSSRLPEDRRMLVEAAVYRPRFDRGTAASFSS
jgi:hypothetical protein